MNGAVIEVRHLAKHFDSVQAVKDVSFSVAPGSICALLGGNGAGKTTTLSILLGLLLPSSGTVRILGEDMLAHRYRVLPRMNFASPYVDLPHRLTVEQNLGIYARLYGVRRLRERIRALARDLDLEALLKRRYGTLSAGQKTRVSLAKAMLNHPDVLLLDEPTASLDPDTGDRVRGYLMDYQASSGATLLLASHNMLEVERMCDSVIMMHQGVIVDQGRPAALVQRYGHRDLEEVFLHVARDGQDTEIRSRAL